MTQLNEHGERILAFIEKYRQVHHCSPSYEEIGSAVGLVSKDHVSRDLRRLKEQGYISFTPGMSRSIVLLKDSADFAPARPATLAVPAVARQRERTKEAGRDWKPEPLDWARIASELVEEAQDVRVLRANGNSMADAFVNDGDLVVIKPRRTATEGEMIAAWLRPQQVMTLKYYHRENGHVRLQPANPELPAMQVRPSDIEIHGQVVAIVRLSR